jgi:anthranilate phosphoribosyltransferase
MSLVPFLHRVAAREDLPESDAREAMLVILRGQATTAQIAAFLVALRMKGETPGEMKGFVAAMREKATRVDPGLNGAPLLDTCGTGGDSAGTFNVSTIAAFVAAGAGARVAKHGNRSLATQCGSADILEALGINVQVEVGVAARAIREIGIGFLFAPLLHPAMKHAQPARLELKMRTVFNLLGPLSNPAGASVQLIGAPSVEAAALMANALAGFEPKRAFVVHGLDGLDEITTTAPTLVYEVHGSQVIRQEWTPEEFGIQRTCPAALKGGSREQNCRIARDILEGVPGPQRDIVLVNAAAALVAAGIASTLREGMQAAVRAIDSGAARAKVEALAEFSGTRTHDNCAAV